MDKTKIYLETSMFSFYHEDRQVGDYQKFRDQVRKVFDLIKMGEYEPYTSRVTITEIERVRDNNKRELMKILIEDYGIEILSESDEINRIAESYIHEKAVSLSQRVDALHIATAAVNGLDFIVSLNFAHIVRIWTIEKVRSINIREGYKVPGIYKPAEVLGIYEDGRRLSE